MGSGTDFEEFGFAGDSVSPATRSWALTIDFEAFRARDVPQWQLAMERWALNAKMDRLSFSFFVAVENLVQLQHESQAAYDQLLSACKRLAAASTCFYAHNHYLFDMNTGRRPQQPEERAVIPAGYRKRPSLFFDVVRRNRTNLGPWLVEVRERHARFLSEAGLAASGKDAFRAGGWDYGSERDEVGSYLEALGTAGFVVDSSATAGEFGARNWRVGAPFGSNLFHVEPGLTEAAPCWSLNCGASVWSRSFADSLRSLVRQRSLWMVPRLPGLLVTVIHFDHLFLGAPDADELTRRIDSFFVRLRWLKRVMGLTCTTLDEVKMSAPS